MMQNLETRWKLTIETGLKHYAISRRKRRINHQTKQLHKPLKWATCESGPPLMLNHQRWRLIWPALASPSIMIWTIYLRDCQKKNMICEKTIHSDVDLLREQIAFCLRKNEDKGILNLNDRLFHRTKYNLSMCLSVLDSQIFFLFFYRTSLSLWLLQYERFKLWIWIRGDPQKWVWGGLKGWVFFFGQMLGEFTLFYIEGKGRRSRSGV